MVVGVIDAKREDEHLGLGTAMHDYDYDYYYYNHATQVLATMQGDCDNHATHGHEFWTARRQGRAHALAVLTAYNDDDKTRNNNNTTNNNNNNNNNKF